MNITATAANATERAQISAAPVAFGAVTPVRCSTVATSLHQGYVIDLPMFVKGVSPGIRAGSPPV